MKRRVVFIVFILAIIVVVLGFKRYHSNDFRYSPWDVDNERISWDTSDARITADSAFVGQSAGNYDKLPSPQPKTEKLNYNTTGKSKYSYEYKPVTIFGDNDIIDYYKVEDKGIKDIAESVAAFISKSDLIRLENGHYKPIMGMLGENLNLKEDEDFSKEKTLSFCTGFVVGSQHILTAGHCVIDERTKKEIYKDAYLVFGWKKGSSGNYPEYINKDDVYEIKNIFLYKQEGWIGDINGRKDYALVITDRPLNKKPLELDRKNLLLEKGNKIFMIGYPAGMSLKITKPGAAEIFDIGKSQFTTNLDGFGGNSGSPVFETYTKRVVGIFVSGPDDFRFDTECDIRFIITLDKNFHQDNVVVINVEDKDVFDYLVNYFKEKGKVVMLDPNTSEISIARGTTFVFSTLPLRLHTAFCGKLPKNYLSRYPDNAPLNGISQQVQAIDNDLAYYVPFTSSERKVCNVIKNRMTRIERVKNPDGKTYSVIKTVDPQVKMLYDYMMCGKEVGI